MITPSIPATQLVLFAGIFDGRILLGLVLTSTFWSCGGETVELWGTCGAQVAGESGWLDGDCGSRLDSLAR